MNEKAKKYLSLCATDVEDEGTSEGVRKAWETRRAGGAAGRWNESAGSRTVNAPDWNSDQFKAAREAHKAHADFVDQLNKQHPGPMGSQNWTSEEIAQKNELAQRWRDSWFGATKGWSARDRVNFMRENNIQM